MVLTGDAASILSLSVQNTTFFADSAYVIDYSLYVPHRESGAPRSALKAKP